MRIPRVDEALSRCKQIHSTAISTGLDVQDLLARALLVLIYAEFEQVIRNQILRRCEEIPDAAVSRFVVSCVENVFRSLGIGALGGLLGRFDDESRREFQNRVDQNTTNMYDSLMRNRNAAAHGEGVSPTLEEIEEYYLHAHVVLDHFREALFRGAPVAREGTNGAA